MTLRERLADSLTGGAYSSALGNLRAADQLLSEARNWAVERAKEDAAWRNLSLDPNAFSRPVDRRTMVNLARRAFLTDPFLKRAVLTMTYFCFGNGIDGPRPARVKDSTVEEARAALQPLNDFWNDRANKAAMFGVIPQYDRSNQLLVDGDLFLTLFVSAAREVQVRRMGSLLVKDILCDPDDTGRALYYVVERREAIFDPGSGKLVPTGKMKLRYYRDFENDDPKSDPFAESFTPEQLAGNDIYVMHLCIDRLEDGGFGNSALTASLPWANVTKMIAQDQATISRATAALMNRLATSGTPRQIDALRQSLQSTSDAGTPDAPLPGGMNILSPGLDLKVDRASTNAGDAWQNSRMMRVAAAAGMGLALHYLADPENANLATSKSMELPILRTLEAYQSLWLSAYRSLFDFVIIQQGLNPEEVTYDIPVPHMVEPDIAGIGKVILDSYDAGLLTKTQAAQRIYELLGYDDIPARLEELENEQADSDQGDREKLEAILSGPAQAQLQPQAAAAEVGATPPVSQAAAT